MHAAAASFELHIPASRSLKAKRAAVRPIVEGIRNRFHVSVAETGFHDQWQRTRIGVAVVAESDGHVREVLDTIERFVASRPDVELLDVETAWLEPDAPLPIEVEVEDGERRASPTATRGTAAASECDRHVC